MALSQHKCTHNEKEFQELNMKMVKHFWRSPKSFQISKSVLIEFNGIVQVMIEAPTPNEHCMLSWKKPLLIGFAWHLCFIWLFLQCLIANRVYFNLERGQENFREVNFHQWTMSITWSVPWQWLIPRWITLKCAFQISLPDRNLGDLRTANFFCSYMLTYYPLHRLYL